MRSVPTLLCLALSVALAGCAAAADAPVAGTIGDTLDVAGTQRITLLEAEVNEGGAGSRPPPGGSVYASFLFRIESLSPDARVDRFGFRAVDGTGDEHPYTAGGRQPALGSSRELPTGEALEGWVSFQVPDDFRILAVRYEPGFALRSEPITFTVRAPEPAQGPPS